MGAIQIDKVDSISRNYQIMVINLLKNWNNRYFSYYIIKFVDFMPIYAINLDIISSYMVFIDCILGLLIYYKFESIILFFLSKKKK